MTSSYAIFPSTHQMAPLIDDSELAKPLTLKLDEPASIVVRISGFPKPTVRWQVGRKRVKESPKFHMWTDGDRTHTLDISRVTRDLEQGVWVVATNVNGEDCCLVEVRSYERSLQRLGSFSNSSVPVKRGGSILSLKEWKQEMAIRNKMRSVDDLAFTADKASLMSGLGYSLSVDVGDSDDPDLDEQFHYLSRHRLKRPIPAATTRLVFPEVEPSRLVPVPNRSTTNASRSDRESTKEKIITSSEQSGDECVKQRSKRNQSKVKRAVKKSTSIPGHSTLEKAQVEVVKEFGSEVEQSDDECVKQSSKRNQSKVKKAVKKSTSIPVRSTLETAQVEVVKEFGSEVEQSDDECVKQSSKQNQSKVKKAVKKSNSIPGHSILETAQVEVAKEFGSEVEQSDDECVKQSSKRIQSKVKKAVKKSTSIPVHSTLETAQVEVVKEFGSETEQSDDECVKQRSKRNQSKVKKAVKKSTSIPVHSTLETAQVEVVEEFDSEAEQSQDEFLKQSSKRNQSKVNKVVKKSTSIPGCSTLETAQAEVVEEFGSEVEQSDDECVKQSSKRNQSKVKKAVKKSTSIPVHSTLETAQVEVVKEVGSEVEQSDDECVKQSSKRNQSRAKKAVKKSTSIPDRSTLETGHAEVVEEFGLHAEQSDDEFLKQSSNRIQSKIRKVVKKLTSIPVHSILETTQVEKFGSDARSSSDLERPRAICDGDVWRMRGEKLADVCQKMLQMFPESKMQTLHLQNISIRVPFEKRDIVDVSMKPLNDSVWMKQNAAVKGVDMHEQPKVKEDKEDRLKVKHRRMLPTEGDSNKGDDELLVNESFVNHCRLNTLQTQPINGESNELDAAVASNLQNELSNSDAQRSRHPNKSHSLSRPLNSEIKQQETTSVFDAAAHQRTRKGSGKTRNKRKGPRSKSVPEFSQEIIAVTGQHNETDAKNNDRKEEQYDENYNIVVVSEEPVEGTRQKSKPKKRGNRRSLQLAARGTQAQKKTKASKKMINEARKSGRVDNLTLKSVEDEANGTTFEENEAFFEIRTFAEIEARTSEQLEHEKSTSKVAITKVTNLKQAKRRPVSSIGNEAEMPGQTGNLELDHKIKPHKKIPKTSGKVNRLSKRERNVTIIGSEFSLLSENDLPDSISGINSSSPRLIANANDSVDPDVLAVTKITDKSEGAVTSGDIEDACTVNLKPIIKKKRKKKKIISKPKVVRKTAAVDRKKREDLRLREDLNYHKDMEHSEDLRVFRDLENFELFADSGVFPDGEIIVQMDREPKSGVRRPDGSNETLNGVHERDREKREENLETASKNINKASKQIKHVENKVENDTRDVIDGITLSERREKTEDEFEEQIIVMDREPRGGTVRLNRTIERLSVVEVAERKRSPGIVSDSQSLTSSQFSLRENSRPPATKDHNVKQAIKKSRDALNEDSPEITHEKFQIHEVSSGIVGDGYGLKSLHNLRGDLNVSKAEESTDHGTTLSSTESRNSASNCRPEFSNATSPELKYIPASNKHMNKTLIKEAQQDTAASKKPAQQVINTASRLEETKRKKMSSLKNSEKAVESISSDESSREFLRSANPSCQLSTVSDQRDVITLNTQQDMTASGRLSLNASEHPKSEPNDPKLSAMNSDKANRTTNSLRPSADVNTIARETDFRIENSENNAQVSRVFTMDAAQNRLPQVTSPVGLLNNTRDQEKTNNDMTNEQTLILKALAERIRSGEVEIIIVNKMTPKKDNTHSSPGNKTNPISGNLINILNANDAVEKVDASKSPLVLMTDEETSQSTKCNEIKFIDSDDSADILETRDHVIKLTGKLGTDSNEKHIDSSATKGNLPENRSGTPRLTAGKPETKLDLSATKAYLSQTKIGLPGAKVDIPGSKVNLGGTKLDLPVTKAHLSQTEVDLPVTKLDLTGTKVNLSRTKLDLPEASLDLQGTKVNVSANQPKSRMLNDQRSGNMVVVQDTSLPASPIVRNDIASNIASERNSNSTAISCFDQTLESAVNVNTSMRIVQSSGKTEQGNIQHGAFIEALPRTISNPTETRKSNSIEVGIVPPKPKPRNSIGDGRFEVMQQNSTTKQSAFASTIIQTQHKLTNKLNNEGLDGVKIPAWHIKPIPRTNSQIQQKPTTSESNDTKNSDGPFPQQKQPQPTPRAKPTTITNISQAQLSNHLSPNDPTVLENKSGPNQQDWSGESTDLHFNPTTKGDSMKSSPVRETQAKLDKIKPPKESSLTNKYSAVASQVGLTTSGNDSSLSVIMTTIPIEEPCKTTQISTGPMEMSSAATQTTTAPVERLSTETQATPVFDKNSLTSHLPFSNIGLSTTSNIAFNYRPIIGRRFATSISPVVTNHDRNTFALGHRYTPFSSPQHSWWNVYTRKLVPDYARQTGLLRNHSAKLQDGYTVEKSRQSQQIHSTGRTWSSYSIDQLSNSTVTTQLDFTQGNRDVDPKSLQKIQRSEQQEISEQRESGRNDDDVTPNTSTLMPTHSLRAPSTNGHLLGESNVSCAPFTEANDASCLSWEQRNPPISLPKDPDSRVSTETEKTVLENSNNGKKVTVQRESSAERNKEEYVSTVVTHEYGEVIVLYSAT